MSEEINGVKKSFQAMVADPDFVETMGLQIVSGRKYEWDRASDLGAMIINEAAAKEFGLDSAIGLKMEMFNHHQEVVGIFKDVYNESFHQEIKPCVLMNYGMMLHKVIIKTNGQNKKETIKHIEKEWQKIVTDVPFKYDFLDDKYNELYKTEEKFGMVIKFSALFSILIACLGLFGMISFTSERRKKEIGIRKAMGATPRIIISTILLESIFITAIFGFIGMILGIITLNSIEGKILEDDYFITNPGINSGTAIFVTILLIICGTLAAYIPAKKAARIKPIVALRDE